MKPKKIPPYGKFRHCETKKIRRKILILSYPETFSLPDFFWNTAQKGSPKKNSALRDKKNSTESLDTPLSINFFATGIFLEHSTEKFT